MKKKESEEESGKKGMSNRRLVRCKQSVPCSFVLLSRSTQRISCQERLPPPLPKRTTLLYTIKNDADRNISVLPFARRMFCLRINNLHATLHVSPLQMPRSPLSRAILCFKLFLSRLCSPSADNAVCRRPSNRKKGASRKNMSFCNVGKVRRQRPQQRC